MRRRHLAPPRVAQRFRLGADGNRHTSCHNASSWLNLVERWFAELANKKLRRGAHRSVRDLNADIRAWIATWNENPKPEFRR